MNIHLRLVSGTTWFNAISAIYGGGYLLGGAAGMDTSLLEGTPFDSYAIPGLILLVVVGGTSMLAAAARLGGHRLSVPFTILAGAILVGWLVAEFVMLPDYWPAQFAYGIVGLVMLIGGLLERSRAAEAHQPVK